MKKLVTIQEAANLAKCSRINIYYHCKQGHFSTSLNEKGTTVIPVTEVSAFARKSKNLKGR